MSLGLRGGAKLHGFLGLLTPFTEGKLRALAGHARTYAQQHDLEATFRSVRAQSGWRLSFHPAAPDVLIKADGGYIVIDAATLEVGPGYHAFVVGFIDYLSRQHQWVWEFRKATLHFADDTGYYSDRNFAVLQTTMATEFVDMCEGFCEMAIEGEIPHSVWLPTDFNLATTDLAATSLGFRDRAFFERPSPERFFPWWEEGLTAQTLKNMALCKMWLEMSWAPPVDADDRRDLENCQGLIDRARARGAEFTDDEGAGDIAALLRGEAQDRSGEARRIGYWRQDAWYVGPGGWSVSLPVCYREEIGDDGQLWSLLYGDRAVYLRSSRYDEAQTQAEWPDPQWPDPKWEGYSEYLRFETDQYRAVIHSGMDEDEDGARWCVWQGMYNARHGSAVISVVSPNASDAAWAEKVLRSIQAEAETSEPE